MPKLNSLELKHKRKILNWAGENWHKLKEASKVKIWCALISKEMPTKLEGSGEDGEFVVKVTVDGNENIPAQMPGNRIGEYFQV